MSRGYRHIQQYEKELLELKDRDLPFTERLKNARKNAVRSADAAEFIYGLKEKMFSVILRQFLEL